MNEIEIVQGDTSPIYKFQRKYDDGTVITTQPKKMWITFKRSPNIEESLFQKTLEDGITFEGGYYKFKLLPEDTNNLNYGEYGFDIAILNENSEKKTLLNNAILVVVEHYTHKKNEV